MYHDHVKNYMESASFTRVWNQARFVSHKKYASKMFENTRKRFKKPAANEMED